MSICDMSRFRVRMCETCRLPPRRSTRMSGQKAERVYCTPPRTRSACVSGKSDRHHCVSFTTGKQGQLSYFLDGSVKFHSKLFQTLTVKCWGPRVFMAQRIVPPPFTKDEWHERSVRNNCKKRVTKSRGRVQVFSDMVATQTLWKDAPPLELARHCSARVSRVHPGFLVVSRLEPQLV